MRGPMLVLLLGLAGCAPAGPPFASVAATLPPVPAGTARIFFYRWLEPYETLTPTTAFLNGAPVGVTEPGAVLYRDVSGGQYTIAVKSEGVFPDQFKTVTVKPGDTVYVRAASLSNLATWRQRWGHRKRRRRVIGVRGHVRRRDYGTPRLRHTRCGTYVS